MKLVKYIIPVVILIAIIAIAQTTRPERADPSEPGMRIATPEAGPVKSQTVTDLTLESVQAVFLSPATQIGREGDLLLVFKGAGFLATSLNPVVRIGEQVFEETIISQDFSELYVVIPREQYDAFESGDFERIEVQNPGGERAALSVTPSQLFQMPIQLSNRALIYGEQGIVVE